MKCNICGIDDAKYFLGSILKRNEVLVCADCASKGTVYDLLPENCSTAVGVRHEDLAQDRNLSYCPQCHSTLKDLLETGNAGCPGCYSTFHKEISLLRGSAGIKNEPVRN